MYPNLIPTDDDDMIKGGRKQAMTFANVFDGLSMSIKQVVGEVIMYNYLRPN